MKRIHVFTSAACNYIPKVRVLVESIRRFHPEWIVHLALADEVPASLDLSNEPFDEIHPLSSLGIPQYRAWAFCHSLVELATAIKPVLLGHLLNRDDCSGVIYLDPDIVIFSKLDEVMSALEANNIALTPHQITPEATLAAIMDNEVSSLKHGVYNLGFIAVSPTETGKAFARWWSSRTYHFCRADLKNGLFTDQRWIDLVPAFFEGVQILRCARLNVAPWNLTTRQIQAASNNNFTVQGEPLGFYHFTGFDSGAHQVMAGINGRDSPAVYKLIEWYARVTRKQEGDTLSTQPWRYGFYEDGSKISAGARIVYRERVDLQSAYPDPFSSAPDSFQNWYLNQGRIEYPDLFISESENLAITLLTTNLTPGFRAGTPDSYRLKRVISILNSGMKDPRLSAALFHKLIKVLRTEGVRGILKRIS